MAAIGDKRETTVNGPALASFVAAGIGAFAVGLFVILNEAGLFAAPALYGPAGGISGRTTLAVVTWLIGWAALHRRWNNRQLEAGRLYSIALLLIGLGIVLCFPPIWSIFG